MAGKSVRVLLLALSLWASGVFAGQPEVDSDRRVTFRLRAPAAKKVGVNVQFASGLQEMSKGADGVWSLTLGPAEPDIYEYSFVVDGQAFSISYQGGSGNDVVLSAVVPEPATWALLSAGVAIIACTLRRRRRISGAATL